VRGIFAFVVRIMIEVWREGPSMFVSYGDTGVRSIRVMLLVFIGVCARVRGDGLLVYYFG
jgi:hypothetical protein